jgi:hypothetical protein
MRKLAALVPQVAFLAACASSHGATGGDDVQLTGAANVACACSLAQVCAADGGCVARPKQSVFEIFARIELLEQVSPRESGVLSHVAEAQASFNAGDPPVSDPQSQPPFKTVDGGEDCVYEASYGQGESWPRTPGLDAGKVSFEVTGATGPIELDPSGGAMTKGWGYLHAETPPALRDRTSTFPDFFDPVFVPSGRPMMVTLEGAADVSATRIAGELPQSFTITSPAVEAGEATAAGGADLHVTWAPAQSSAFMEIFVTMDLGGDLALLSCTVQDDGSTVIPKAAMNMFSGSLGLQLRRTTERYTRFVMASGKVVNASVLGRHARLGSFTLK